jgi:RNA polymerase sigma-70 factor (ECF subfamily)
MTTIESSTPADIFSAYRPLLFSIAYRMTGSGTEAEDLVQDAYVRWHNATSEGNVGIIREPKSWLTTTITRLAIDHLKSARVRREQYVGAWLPEPLETAGGDDPAEDVELAESLSIAFLVLLEQLTPVERAVFLLHEVFGYGYAEIAEIVGKSEANCRQLARRARESLVARRPRFRPDTEQGERLLGQFLRACTEGDMPGLVSLLAADATIRADGGGKAPAARRPVVGAERVATFALSMAEQAQGVQLRPTWVNGQPAFVASKDGAVLAIWVLDIADGKIQAIWAMLNPDKLARIRP